MKTKVHISLMGPAREFHPEGKITLELNKGPLTVQTLKEAFVNWICTQNLEFERRSVLDRSVFADTKKILRKEDPIQPEGEYVLIPPISGG